MDQPSLEEKALAALAHASGVLFFLGPIGAVIIWTIQREKSKYVRYHALQALGFQTYSFRAWMIASFLFTLAFIVVSLVIIILTSDSSVMPPSAILAIEAVFFLFFIDTLGLAFLLQFAAIAGSFTTEYRFQKSMRLSKSTTNNKRCQVMRFFTSDALTGIGLGAFIYLASNIELGKPISWLYATP